MDDKADTGGRAEAGISGRLNMKIAGPAIAAGVVSLGLVLIGSCGVGHKDTFVAPPPLNADLHVAASTLTGTRTTISGVVSIPPSPSWTAALSPAAPGPYSIPSLPLLTPTTDIGYTDTSTSDSPTTTTESEETTTTTTTTPPPYSHTTTTSTGYPTIPDQDHNN
ncbi:MAG: hypothetical protein J2P18_11600 [Nocardia sp.]|nr:hypothetical protein [Nocardia sp.]